MKFFEIFILTNLVESCWRSKKEKPKAVEEVPIVKAPVFIQSPQAPIAPPQQASPVQNYPPVYSNYPAYGTSQLNSYNSYEEPQPGYYVRNQYNRQVYPTYQQKPQNQQNPQNPQNGQNAQVYMKSAQGAQNQQTSHQGWQASQPRQSPRPSAPPIRRRPQPTPARRPTPRPRRRQGTYKPHKQYAGKINDLDGKGTSGCGGTKCRTEYIQEGSLMPLDYKDQRCVPYFRSRIDAKNVCNSHPGVCTGVVASSTGGEYFELRGGKACPKLKGGDPWNKPYGNEYAHGK